MGSMLSVRLKVYRTHIKILKKMKRILTLFLALTVSAGVAFAGPVSKERAKVVGQKFVRANFSDAETMELVYTASSDAGDLYYAFSVGENGFVVVAADDAVHPILAYSTTSAFTLDVAPAKLFLDAYGRSVEKAIRANAVAAADVALEWANVESNGAVRSGKGGRTVGPLVQTKWNQDYPYNIKCPTDNQGPGGHVYAGCAATAMGQVMKFWDHPTQGTGSHSYHPSGYPNQSVNYGATTYDWANMPNSISSSSSTTQINAIGTLLWHCGVAVNMMYSWKGSGAYSEDVPPAIKTYFKYGDCESRYRSGYSAEAWEQMLRDHFDCGLPAYYHGQDPDPVDGGGHAFVCDGYDDNGLFHFNFGWSGSGDGFFKVTDIDFNTSDGAILYIMPQEIHASMAVAPSMLNVVPNGETELSGVISCIVPNKSRSGATLTSINKIVFERNGEIIGEVSNPTPGAQIQFNDNSVPCYGAYDYVAYAVVNDVHGMIQHKNNVMYGPTCGWKIAITAQTFSGWGGASVDVYNSAGKKINSFTSTSSGTITKDFEMPLGNGSFAWSAPTNTNALTISFVIKDASGNSIYTYSGTTTEMTPGTFLSVNNDCNSGITMEAPRNLYATAGSDNISLTWDGVTDKGLGYNIYRDGALYRIVQETTFVDENLGIGGHCYEIRVLGDGGESDPSNESCATIGDNCNPATNLHYEITSAGKPKLIWTKPNPSTGLTGYMIYKRTGESGEWNLIKQAGPSTTNYTDNSGLEEGVNYFYRVVAYYRDIECYSAPAQSSDNDQRFYVVFGPLDVEEVAENVVAIYPNPTNGIINIKAENISSISVFNLVGQKIYDAKVNTDQVSLDMSVFGQGLYLVRINANGVETTKRVAVAK